ncbi:hypothetical protein BKG60_02200 [Mycobacterium syngnathidarum]|nr:hypothetical protein BKG60_02200 [Mycobacterium syngnathidarum]
MGNPKSVAYEADEAQVAHGYIHLVADVVSDADGAIVAEKSLAAGQLDTVAQRRDGCDCC